MIDWLNSNSGAAALLIAITAFGIGFYNLYAQLRACIIVSRIHQKNGNHFLVIKNSGPGTATVDNVRALKREDSSPVDFIYTGDREVFPFELGSGASYELFLRDQEASFPNVLVEWRDGLCWKKQSRRIPISQFSPTV